MSEKKNIAFLTPDLRSGGSERVASRLTKLFSDKYNIYYIVFDDRDKSYEVDAELINLNIPATHNFVKKVMNLVRRASAIRRICKKKNIEVIFSFTPSSNISLRFAKPKCRWVGSCRGFEDLETNTADYHKMIEAGGEILFNAREMEEYFKSKYPDDADRCHTIENLVDCQRIVDMSKEALTEEEQRFYDTHKVVSTVGILSQHKGHWDLFKSFELLKEKVPDAGLVLVGHRGIFEEQLKDMAKRNKYAEDILLTGYSANPFKYVAKSDVYAMSSISEGFPNALIEAMTTRTAVVSTACATGPAEILYDEYRVTRPDKWEKADNGIITPVFDGIPDFDYNNKNWSHGQFADALAAMLNDDEMRQSYAEKGYKRAWRNDEAAISDEYFKYINL